MIVLDIMLPDVDGIQLCTDFRNSSTIPILMVSAKNEVSDRVKGLQTGADDYLCKPFSMRELSARIQALLRRSQRLSSARFHLPSDVHNQQGIHLDLEKRCLYVSMAKY